jgi:hypothetical protein
MDDDYLYGQATDDGAYDDVETHGPGGTEFGGAVATDMALAWGMVALALAALWFLGAGLFRGSNQS